ncbi:CapA family protein [candidate division KSB1 bacterium]|nr:CapA family protein [candidate division KSB1 bacterium]
MNLKPQTRIKAKREVEKRPFPLVSITAVGDLMLSSYAADFVRQKGVDYPFDSTRTFVAAADIAIANLEAPLSNTGTRFADKTFTFKVPPYFVAGIKNAGFDVVTCANNHIVDFGCEGLENTLAILDSMGIKYCGAGENVTRACSETVVEHFGVRVAFLGYSMTYPQEFWATAARCGTCYPTDEKLINTIKNAQQNADLVVVSFHWGGEKRIYPKNYQTYFAHLAVDSGADLVLGHHPHVLQGMEIYKGRLIAYSLGNYAFGSYSHNSRDSICLKTFISPSGLVYARLFPISVYNYDVHFQPRPLRGGQYTRVIQQLNEISAGMNGGRHIIHEDGTIMVQ